MPNLTAKTKEQTNATIPNTLAVNPANRNRCTQSVREDEVLAGWLVIVNTVEAEWLAG